MLKFGTSTDDPQTTKKKEKVVAEIESCVNKIVFVINIINENEINNKIIKNLLHFLQNTCFRLSIPMTVCVCEFHSFI